MKLVVRVMHRPLRYQDEQMLLDCGATIVVPADVKPPGLLSLLEAVQGQVYVRTLMENGVGGFLSLMLFLGLTQLVAIRTALARSPSAATAAVIAASLLGTLVNGVFVDTLHWRSLWIQVGLAWGLYAVCLQQQRFNRWHQLVAARTN